MKILIAVIVSLALSGCASVKSWIPSFWDDNQSAKIVDVRLAVDRIDCSQPQLAQAQRVRDDLRWFELYSQSKGWRQADVLRIIKPMQETVEDWYRRSLDAQGSKGYCEIKKKILQQQSERAAQAVLGRF
jgi:hypothetical protein